MKVALACDVDPVLPTPLPIGPIPGAWACLDLVDTLVKRAGNHLPPITWCIRADESVRVATGDFASGYRAKRRTWDVLVARGHEMGWHMHLMSPAGPDPRDKRGAAAPGFRFDPDPPWLADAMGALSSLCGIRASRTGWDYGSNVLFRRLDALGIRVDLSALPGDVAWHRVGADRVVVDWLRCPERPYHPAADDYQQPGGLSLLEVPVARFPNPLAGVARRLAWRVAHGRPVLRGLRTRTRLVTESWPNPPRAEEPVCALFFHPEDLAGDGTGRLLANLERLAAAGAGFVTASAARELVVAGAARTQDTTSPQGRYTRGPEGSG